MRPWLGTEPPADLSEEHDIKLAFVRTFFMLFIFELRLDRLDLVAQGLCLGEPLLRLNRELDLLS